MPAVMMGVLGNLEYARELGKKGTESDVQLVTFREGDVNVSLIVPFRYPDKVQPLAYAVNAGDSVLIVVKEVNRELGESIVAAAAAGHTRGLIVLQNYVQPEQIKPLLKGTSLEALPIVTDDKPSSVRQRIVELAAQPKEGPVRIPIENHFNVKGIGTVILGFVKQGSVKKHDNLRAFPSTKSAQVRSIQVHDVDVAEAVTGDHVGLALKNIETDDLDRGFVLAPDGSLSVAEINTLLPVDVTVSAFFKQGLKNEGVYHLSIGWQVVSARVKGADIGAGKTGKVSFEISKAIAYSPGDRVIVLHLDNPALRILGHGTIG